MHRTETYIVHWYSFAEKSPTENQRFFLRKNTSGGLTDIYPYIRLENYLYNLYNGTTEPGILIASATNYEWCYLTDVTIPFPDPSNN